MALSPLVYVVSIYPVCATVTRPPVSACVGHISGDWSVPTSAGSLVNKQFPKRQCSYSVKSCCLTTVSTPCVVIRQAVCVTGYPLPTPKLQHGSHCSLGSQWVNDDVGECKHRSGKERCCRKSAPCSTPLSLMPYLLPDFSGVVGIRFSYGHHTCTGALDCRYWQSCAHC